MQSVNVDQNTTHPLYATTTPIALIDSNAVSLHSLALNARFDFSQKDRSSHVQIWSWWTVRENKVSLSYQVYHSTCHFNSSSTNGHIATVFGCTGFLGRYVVSKLGMYCFGSLRRLADIFVFAIHFQPNKAHKL